MPLVVTPADVTTLSELVRRLRGATSTLDQLATSTSKLLVATSWTGSAAAAARTDAQHISLRLRAASAQAHALTGTAMRLLNVLSGQLAHERAVEHTVLRGLDGLAAFPGDLEAGARAVVRRLHLSRPLGSLLP